MMDEITISATAMGKFAECPRKYYWYKRIKPQTVPKWIEDGLDAHALMAGEMPETAATPQAIYFARKLREMEEACGYKVLGREFVQRIPIYKTNVYTIRLHRRLDVLVTMGDSMLSHPQRPMVVDYKTGSSTWDVVEGRVPRAEGYQSVAYTFPCDTAGTPFEGHEWPSSITYLLATSRGQTQVYHYDANDEDQEEFVDRAKEMRRADSKERWPRHKGWQCKTCDFAKACFDRPGWQNFYEDRRIG